VREPVERQAHHLHEHLHRQRFGHCRHEFAAPLRRHRVDERGGLSTDVASQRIDRLRRKRALQRQPILGVGRWIEIDRHRYRDVPAADAGFLHQTLQLFRRQERTRKRLGVAGGLEVGRVTDEDPVAAMMRRPEHRRRVAHEIQDAPVRVGHQAGIVAHVEIVDERFRDVRGAQCRDAFGNGDSHVGPPPDR
jgi:hypothetical protein